MTKKISPLTALTYGSVSLLIVVFFSFVVTTGSALGGIRETGLYYLTTTGQSLAEAVLLTADFLAIFIAFLAVVSLLRNFLLLIRKTNAQPTIFGSTSVRGAFRNILKKLRDTLVTIFPAILFLVVLSLTLSEMNAVDHARLMDITIISWERWLTGGYVFAILGNMHWPTWFLSSVIFSFNTMSGIVIVAAFVIALVRIQILREMIAAFCFGMLLMVPLWFAFPALSPQDRFIDNIYRLPVPQEISAAVADYHPQVQIANFLKSARNDKAGLTDLPTSTMPSAHILWATLVGYYLWKTRRWFGWVALPILLASSFGTVLLAQHYFLDIFVGICVSAFTIWVVENAAREDKVSHSVIPAKAGTHALK